MKKEKANQMQKEQMLTLLILIVILGALLIALFSGGAIQTTANAGSLQGKTILIDVGHGGFDGGAVGASGTTEAHINLSIAKRLKAALEAKGAVVFLTRKENVALGETKEEDMRARREIISSGDQDITISIHQNKFQNASAKGPQVFYAPGSKEGERLAASIQNAMNVQLTVAKPRVQMEGNYYIVKSGKAPSVIVECGFLSNPEEEILLKKGSYQILIAKSITSGIETYFFDEGKVQE